jgi:nucleoside-diphosphate-sugar epimerase
MPESMPSGAAQHDGFGSTNSTHLQRILVLGASGFIGRRIVRMLTLSDWAVPIAASRSAAPHPGGSVETLRLDATQAASMRDALQGVAGVVNCIAGDSESIVGSAKALFTAVAPLTPPPRIVHLSTMMVYGTAVGTVDESAVLKGDWDDYSAAKTEVEHLARACKSVVQLRPGIVYGPDSPIWSGQVGRWLRQRRLGDLGEAGSGYCNLVHVDDVVEAVLRALRMPGIEGEAFNLSLPSPPTWNDYFRQYATALGTDVVPISHHRLLFEQYLLAPPLKIAELASRRLRFRWRPPVPIRPWFVRLCGQALRLDVGKAERDLGLRWTPLDQGLRESAAWLLARNASSHVS